MKRDPLKPLVVKPGSRPAKGYPLAGTKLGPRRPAGGYIPNDGKLANIRKAARRGR